VLFRPRVQNSAHYFARSQEKEPHDPLSKSPRDQTVP
jgi:hypothetical protein